MEKDRSQKLPVVRIPGILSLIDDPKTVWEPLRPGIEAHWLYRWPTGQSAALLRYSPGAALARHQHTATEQILILRGSQQDENGVHEAGTLLVHPAGASHTVRSSAGCVALAIWEQPVSFNAKE